VILEQLGITDIAAQCIHASVSAHVHHFENRRATFCRRREETGSKRVAGELSRIESDAGGMSLDDKRYRLIRHSPRPNLPCLVDWPEYWTLEDACSGKPCLEGLGRTGNGTPHNGDRRAGAVLVRLLCRMVILSPSLVSSKSATSRATSSERRNAPGSIAGG
jgi:hypothetical protein